MMSNYFSSLFGIVGRMFFDVDDVIGRADRFRFQNFCSPALGHCEGGGAKTAHEILKIPAF